MGRLTELSALATAGSDLSPILHETLIAAIELQDADFGDIRLYDEQTQTLKIVAKYGLEQGFLDDIIAVDDNATSVSGLALRMGTRIVVDDVNDHPDCEALRCIAAAAGIRGMQSTPLLDRKSGKPLATFSTYFREPHRPSEREMRLIDVCTRQAADVIAFWLTERALCESEARLCALLDQVPGGVSMFDRDGRIILRGGPLSHLWDDKIPSRDPESVRRWRGFDANGGLLPFSQYPGRRALRGETVAPGLDFIRTADDGSETWFRVSAAPFRDGTGEITGAVAILQNVDEEKRAQQRLRESEARLQAAADLVNWVSTPGTHKPTNCSGTIG